MTTIDDLAERLTRELSGGDSRPGEAGYDRVVAIWAEPPVRPELVAHCLNEQDVRTAVVAAREGGVALSVRGGGHDLAGRSLCEGITLDMTAMNTVGPITSDRMRHRPSPLCTVLCHEFSGAAAQVPSSATAFALRRPHIWFEAIAPTDPEGASDGQAEARWVQDLVDDLAAHSFPGGYPNMLEPGNGHRAQLGFGGNATRLVQAKRRYDPQNVFRSATELGVG